MKRARSIIHICIGFFLILVGLRAHSQIVINSVSTTPITCPNNGSITVDGLTASPPLLYSIVAGPVTQPVQSNSTFTSLPAGTYQVQLSDGIGQDTIVEATISGTYQNPNFTANTVKPYCVGGNDAELTGIATAGTAPFTWELMAPSPVTAPPQTSNHFGNLTAGFYTVRLTDACGGYKTSVITIGDHNTTNIFNDGLLFNKVGCDSMNISYRLVHNELRLPLIFKYTTTAGTFTYSYTNVSQMDIWGGFIHVKHVIPGLDYGDYAHVTVYNACGDSTVSWADIHPYNFYPKFSFGNCGLTVVPSFTNSPTNFHNTGIMPPIGYTVTHVASNTIHDQGTVDVVPGTDVYSTFLAGITTAPAPPSETYQISITDGCGETFTQQYTTPSQAPPAIVGKSIIQKACIDSVVGLYRVNAVGFLNGNLIVTSGPGTLGSTKPDFTYSDTYTYPKTVNAGYMGETWFLQNLAAGTYHFKIVDDCGYELHDSIVIQPSQVTNLTKQMSYKKGCLGQNKIYFGMRERGKVTIKDISTHAVIKVKEFFGSIYDTDSALNVPPGQYEILIQYDQGGFGTPINNTFTGCWTTRDTITIEDYQTPEMSTGNAILCNDDINMVLYPDTTTGVPAYQYEVISGPQTFPVQNSNIFTVSTPGTYVARIYDACGNASIKQITIDTLSFDPIQANTGCGNAFFSFPTSLYHTYHWLMPNGQVHIGDSLIISPITPADTGTYHISKIIDINGCLDTLYTSYHVTQGSQSYQTIHFCQGTSVSLGNNTYTQPGVYNDTLTTTAGCDSIVVSELIMVSPPLPDTLHVNICQGDSLEIAGIFHHISGFYADSAQNAYGCYETIVTQLTVNYLSDTLNVSVCTGQSYGFGSGTYNAAGYYADTLTTVSGCDSISILHLTVQPHIQDSIQVQICAGQTYPFAGLQLNQPGVYSDTLVTLACDSIVTLTLSVLPYIQDSVQMDICPGQTYDFGGIPLSQPGIYSDTLSAASGCDSIVTLTLSILPYIRDSIETGICPGLTYTLGGLQLSQPGIYSDTLSTISGCDSIVTLTLSLLPHIQDSLQVNICPGETYFFAGVQLNQPGTYSDTLSTASGCDSVLVLTLSAWPYVQHTLDVQICPGESYMFGGNAVNQPGTYTDTLSTNACDSIVTLNLSVLPYQFTDVTESICQGESFYWGGSLYTSPGTYTDTLSTSSCDSIVTLTLYILPAHHADIFATVCAHEKYTFGNHDYIHPGTYTHAYQTVNGCDSTVVLHLSVSHTPSVHIAADVIDMHNGALIYLDAVSSDNPLTYQWTANSPLNSYHIPNPTANLNESGWFYVTVTNTDGCSAGDSLFVEMPVTSTLYIPNTFTPDGDHNNGTFRIYGTNIAEFNIMVFNRWGELIFESNNMDTGWDATYMGHEVQNGMYVYKVKAKGTDYKKYDWIGHIIVLR